MDGFKQKATASVIEKAEYGDTKSYITKLVRKQLKKRYSSGEYRFTVQPRWIPNRLLQQPPKQILGVQLQGEIRRYTNFEVFYRRRGDRRRVEIQYKVEAKQKLPVVADRIEKGAKLTREQLAFQWVALGRHGGTYIANMQQLVGRTLRRTLLSGQPIRTSDVSRDLIIKAGDEVKVFIQKSGVQVQVTGVARQNGARVIELKFIATKHEKNMWAKLFVPE